MTQETINPILEGQINLFEEPNQQLSMNSYSEKVNMQSHKEPLINLDRYEAYCINRGLVPGNFKSLDRYIKAEREACKAQYAISAPIGA